MTLALLREMQVCKLFCGLYQYAWFKNGSHVPCTYTIGFRLSFVFVSFYLHNNKIQQINVIFNRLLRFAITWRLHYSKTGETRQDIVLKRIKSHF